jgi:hypothetical protein
MTPAFLKLKTRPSENVKLWHSFKLKKYVTEEQAEGSGGVKEEANYSEKNTIKLSVT